VSLNNIHEINRKIGKNMIFWRKHLKKLGRAEGGANIFGVFRVKNHDFTPKNHIFSNFSVDLMNIIE
jgi:hypothetical protein